MTVIRNALGNKALLELIVGAMSRAAERWRAVKVTDFEQRRMATIGAERNTEYEAQIGLNEPNPQEKRSDKLSGKSRT